ncbi:MAG: RNA methyltransferase [Clostridia bacterium]|nr:RNA methyltransferase [Clostridia bacterium]
MEVITSRQNPKVKALLALSDKKGREKQGLFRFDGIKLFDDALGQCETVCIILRHPLSEAVQRRVDSALSSGAVTEKELIYVSEGVFEKLTEESSPEGIITVARFLTELHRRSESAEVTARELSGKRILLAESLRDTGNVGTVMRSCAALGIDTLVMSSDCADLYNPKTVRSSMGALFRLPTLSVKKEDMPELVGALRAEGRRVYAAALRDDACRIGEFTLRDGDCFIIGNEGHGLSEELIEACDSAAIIPMREGNESLNAAAAATICIWETVRASRNDTSSEKV